MFPGLDSRLDKAVFLEARFCPHRCGATVFAKDMQDHRENHCPFRMAICPEGCGERIHGTELEAHKEVCAMNILLLRAEAAVRESTLKEYRMAMNGALQERDRANARIVARGEIKRINKKRPGWPSEECTTRVERIEASSRDMVVRLRRRAKDRMISALAQSCADPESDMSTTKSAMTFWDAIDEGSADRGSRPWDLNPPTLLPLQGVLEDAAECGADEKLRRKCEVEMLAVVRRLLESAMLIAEDRHAGLLEAFERATPALRAVEMTPWDVVGELYQQAQEEIHRAACNELPDTPPEFHDALANGDTALCEWFLYHQKGNPSAPDPRTGLLPLVVASKAGDLPMCSLLIDCRVDIDARGPIDGCTALHWAAHLRSSLVMNLLLECRANPRIQDKRGQDALMKLVRRDIVAPAPGVKCLWQEQPGERLDGEVLANSGIMDVESAQVAASHDEDCIGFRFRNHAWGGRMEVELLAAFPAPPAPSEKSSRPSSKEEARPGSKEEAIRPPTNASPSRPATGHKGSMPSRPGTRQPGAEEGEAAEEFWTSFIKVPVEPAHDIQALLAFAADPNAGDSEGLTPLHHHLIHVARGSEAAVAALVRGGADVNQRDASSRSTTPLVLAVRSKNAAIVRLMLNEAWPPADVDAKDAEGTSVLALAEGSGARDVARMLQDKGASKWSSCEVRLGKNTCFSFDTRAPPVPA